MSVVWDKATEDGQGQLCCRYAMEIYLGTEHIYLGIVQIMSIDAHQIYLGTVQIISVGAQNIYLGTMQIMSMGAQQIYVCTTMYV